MERSKGTEAQQQASAAGLPEAVVTQLRNTGPVGRLEDVGLIVLDEVHYLSDPYRCATHA